ncbi:Dehydrogenase FUM7 [Hyphodiscus hymeniophilus]|uniref:Dehydrogenase FUM7 n=1 Tax=Hyphodiscus hymeniophilus TaxID=353542 RepID=A0A9P6VKH0_9HELO|nr:Dehydrogenase FUM7 [Hyphodiscus hymeniophilus]
MPSSETYKKAFDEPPAVRVSGTAEVGTLVTPHISYGLPYTEACAKHVTVTFKASRVYIIASGTLSRETDRLERLIAALEEKNVQVVGVKKGMRPHTPWSQIIEIAVEAKALKVDCFVTLGAGSLTDGAKIIVLAMANNITDPKDLADYSVEAKTAKAGVESPTIPVICIPTSLSGGEYFALAGGTDDITTKHKQGFMQNGMGVSLVILDAELSIGTPWFHWLSTGMRSIDHCVEALCSLEATPQSDEDAEAGLRLLIPRLLETKLDEKNVEARHQCQLGVRYAMKNVRAGIPMGGSHAIGHQLGPMGVGHGVTSCIMCPAVMKWNIAHGKDIPEIEIKQNKVRSILWSLPSAVDLFKKNGLTQEKADLGDLLDVIIRTLGLPRTLKEVDIGEDQIDALSVRTLADFWAPTNPIPLVEAAQVKSILEMVLN